MAQITISASFLQEKIGRKFEKTKHIVVSFLRKGFEISNVISAKDLDTEISVFFAKNELIHWSNADSRTSHAIGKSKKISL
jgi:hypothetical protein